MNCYILAVIMLLITPLNSFGQEYPAYFSIHFSDKTPSNYSIDKPEKFLSDRAIQRRLRQNISVNDSDLPVPSKYLNQVVSSGATVIHTSKWLNSATVYVATEQQLNTIKSLSFVSDTELLKYENNPITISNKNNVSENTTYSEDEVDQINQVGGEALHSEGFWGENIWIAVLDGGFKNIDKFESLEHLFYNNRIIGTKDFTSSQNGVFDDSYHGSQVLSVLAGEFDGDLTGSAPDASYFLLQTENVYSETPLEIENWIAALEYADSLGVDVVNSSLGYCTFDENYTDYNKSLFDGESIRISKAASIGVSKGIVVVNSVGNEGNKDWNYLVAPADSKSAIAVGGVSIEGNTSYFSSPGPNQNNNIKPDVVALATGTSMEIEPNVFGKKSGTSYSTPVISGLIACLLESNNRLTPKEIMEMLHSSASNSSTPNNEIGYGIPDFSKLILGTNTNTKIKIKPTYQVYPNPCQSYIKLNIKDNEFGISQFKIFDVLGSKIANGQIVQESDMIIDVSALAKGIYFIRIENKGESETLKFIKQ